MILEVDPENLLLRAWILRPREDVCSRRYFVFYNADHDVWVRLSK